jgi:hypothetical protein
MIPDPNIARMNKSEYLISQETLKIVLKSLEGTEAGQILRREIERQDQDPDTSIIDLCLTERISNIFAKSNIATYCHKIQLDLLCSRYVVNN